MDPEKQKEDEEWLKKYRDGYAALKEGKKKLEEKKAVEKAEREAKSIKPVNPVELHEYNTVNASFSTRLTLEPIRNLRLRLG